MADPSTETQSRGAERATTTPISSTSTARPFAADYRTVVDVVEAGADDTGEAPINDVLERVVGDGVAVFFPPGEYRLDPIDLSGSNWALIGDDATLVVPGDVDGKFLSLDGDGWTVRGVTVDLSADGAAPVHYLTGRDWTFEDVEFVGQMSRPEGDSMLLYPAVDASGATGLMENVVATDGSAAVGESSNHGLTWFGQNNIGRLTWRGCHFSGWANNTLYGANSTGRLVLEDCLFENTNVGVRIGGNTVVRNCVWQQDGRVPSQRWTGDSNARGLWLNSNQYVPGKVLVEGCDFVMTGSDATSAVESANPVDDVVIRDTRIRQTNDQPAIRLPGTGALDLQGVRITGSSPKPAVEIHDRDGSTIRQTCVQKPGEGIQIANSAGCRIADTTVSVGGEPFVFRGATVEMVEVSRDGVCQNADI